MKQARAQRGRLGFMPVLVGLLVMALWVPAAGAGRRSSPEEVLSLAERAFAEGLRLEEAREGSGAAAFLRSADQYQRVMDEGGIQNHALHAARGSAFLLAGDVGRSIAAFRRAERLDPTSVEVRRGLATARARVSAVVSPSIEHRAAGWALAWRGHVPRSALLVLAMAGWAMVWTAAGVGVALRRRVGRWVVAGVLVACTGAAPLALEEVLARQASGVVVSEGVIGMDGPGRGVYPPTFEAPLPAGVEFVILEQRDGWVRVRLGDGRTTWLPTEAIERV